jgi:hypothetical protein
VEDLSMNRATSLLAALAVLGFLCQFTGLNATDKKADTPAKTEPAPMGTAVKPKPLSDEVKKGLVWLVQQQKDNGGWGQGGGWRTSGQGGGRVEGQDVKDPPDVGNTCFAVLALIRAGNTTKEGPYAKNVAKGIEFICSRVEKSDDKTLYVTDVRDTQLQSKIGPYVDTFLVSMVLSELKGKEAEEKLAKRIHSSLNRTVEKMTKHQKADGTFEGNTGWASVLSQGLANKGFARATQAGIALPESTIARVQNQVATNYDAKGGGFRAGGSTALGGLGTGGFSGKAGGIPAASGAPSDAGVGIYTASTYLTNSADVTNALRRDEKKAKETLARKDASKEEKEKAQQTLKDIDKNDKLREEATAAVVKQLEQPAFVQGFGSNGGEEFLSFMNLSEALLLKGGKEWQKWDSEMTKSITRVQDKDGSWSGQHCITGKTFCTAGALLVLMADRAPIPVVAKGQEKK